MREVKAKRDGWIPIGFWLAFVVARLGVALKGNAVASGNDDLARLVQVRQWMAGQPWFDLTQYRLNPPTGVAMHWTRHTDLLLAGLLWMAGGPGEGAEGFAVIALPLLLALAAYMVVAAIARQVGGRPAVPATLLLLFASAMAAQQFAPGRIDHHGLQIVLLLVAVLGLVRFEDSSWALGAGLAAGMSLSVGLEQALVVVGVIAAVGVIGVVQDDLGPSLRRFSASMVASAMVGSMAFAPPSRLFGLACDVFSLPHLVAVGIGAVTLLALALTRRRLTTLIAGGLVAAAAAFAVAPRCVDPYADVDPLLRRLWLANVAEAQGFAAMVRDEPAFALALAVPGTLALAFAVWMWRRTGWGTGMWFRLTAVITVGYATAFVQIRGASVATALSVPVLGVVFVRVRARLDSWPLLGRVGAMAVVVLVISGLAPLVLGGIIENRRQPEPTSAGECAVSEGALAALDGVILAPIDLGPDLLYGTDAGVVAAPYHRNNEGNRLAWDLFMGAPGDADFVDHGIDWVVTCEGMNENGLILREAPDGLLAALLQGDPPASLELTDLGADGLAVYRVRG